MKNPIKIIKKCKSLDEFIDVIVTDMWRSPDDFYIDIISKQIETYSNQIYNVDFLVLKDKIRYIQYRETFNIDYNDEENFKSVLDNYISQLKDGLSNKGVITEIGDDGIKVYSLTKALKDKLEGKEQPYNFEKLIKMNLVK